MQLISRSAGTAPRPIAGRCDSIHHEEREVHEVFVNQETIQVLRVLHGEFCQVQNLGLKLIPWKRDDAISQLLFPWTAADNVSLMYQFRMQ